MLSLILLVVSVFVLYKFFNLSRLIYLVCMILMFFIPLFVSIFFLSFTENATKNLNKLTDDIAIYTALANLSDFEQSEKINYQIDKKIKNYNDIIESWEWAYSKRLYVPVFRENKTFKKL